MTCPYCHKDIPDGSTYCTYCGQAIGTTETSSTDVNGFWNAVTSDARKEDEKFRANERRQEEKKKSKQKSVIACIIIAVIVLLTIVYTAILQPQLQYKKADELLQNGDYENAIVIYEKLGNYKDASEQIAKCQDSIKEQTYIAGVSEYQNGNYEEARTIFEELNGYKDSEKLKYNCNVQLAQQLEPIYYWDFSNSLSEQNGLESTVCGDTTIREVSNANIRQAAYFDGDGDYIECGTGINLTENFTFNILLSCQDVYKKYSAFFAKFENNDAPYAFAINQGHINCWFSKEDGYHTEVESSSDIKNNEWYFISIVKQGENIKLYINGQLDVEDTVTSVCQGEDLVTIGRQALLFYPEDQLQFTGYIGEISIYEKNLSDDEIQTLYQSKFSIPIDTEPSTSPSVPDTDMDTTEIDVNSPFNQDYWVIFTEGNRGDRVEASTIDSSLSPDSIYIIWDSGLYLNDTSGSDRCDQYCLEDNDEWTKIGDYSRLTDRATNVIASNLDIYDADGNLLIEGCPYSEIDWDLINSYR